MSTATEAWKVVYEWRVRPGERAAFELAVKELIAHAGRDGRLEGSSVLQARDDYFVLLRFVDRAALDAFTTAEPTRRLLAAAARHAVAADRTQLRSGLETWFTLPGQDAHAAPPPKWKMALVTWCALLPQVIVLALLLPPLPFPFGPAVSTAIPVAMLTWVVMPRLTRLLAGWLYPRSTAS